jgi:hypothetical protein
MVDPTNGTITGIIDWEFANTLPPQAVEHYPGFLIDREWFVDMYSDTFDNPNAEFDDWRAYYAKQFDDPETVQFNSRIDAIAGFEYLIRHLNERPFAKIAEAVNALKTANALTAPLPSPPWETLATPEPATNSTNGTCISTSAENKLLATQLHPSSITLKHDERQNDTPLSSANIIVNGGVTSIQTPQRPTTQLSPSESVSTNITVLNKNFLSSSSIERSPSPLSVDHNSARSHLSPPPKRKVNDNTDNSPSSPLGSVISSAQSSTFSVKESHEHTDSTTRPELSNPPPATTELNVSKSESDNVPASELPLSRTAADMATQTELFKESNKITEVEIIAADDIINAPDLSKLAADMATQTELFKDPGDETTELEVTTSDDVTASPLPPLKSVIRTAMQTTAKMVVDTTAQTDHSFPPNQGLPEKESLSVHAREKWFSTVAGGCVRIFRQSKRAGLRKRKRNLLCHRGTVVEGIEMQES